MNIVCKWCDRGNCERCQRNVWMNWTTRVPCGCRDHIRVGKLVVRLIPPALRAGYVGNVACPCEGTGIAGGTWADYRAGKYNRADGSMLNMAICHCRKTRTYVGRHRREPTA